jgi:hypothetical protein
MLTTSVAPILTRLESLEARVRETTHGRIRGLRVEEDATRLVVHGTVPSRHSKQLAIQAALEFLTEGKMFDDRILVG